MLTFFGTIIIVYFLWLVVKPLLARYMQRKFRQKVNDMFGQAFGDAFGQTPGEGDYTRGSYGGRNAAGGYGATARKGKIFSRDEGEYVEFEEIRVTASEETSRDDYAAAAGGNSHRHTPHEPQVSDAEWDDIN